MNIEEGCLGPHFPMNAGGGQRSTFFIIKVPTRVPKLNPIANWGADVVATPADRFAASTAENSPKGRRGAADANSSEGGHGASDVRRLLFGYNTLRRATSPQIRQHAQ